MLAIFDYLDRSGDGETLPIREEEGAAWNPLKLKGLEERFAAGGWTILKITDISPKFADWYSDLLSRIEEREKQIVDSEGPAWYRFVHDFYGGMLSSIKQGSLGGVLVYAKAD